MGGFDGDDARGAAAGHDVAVEGVEFLLLWRSPGGGGEVGDLIDRDQVDREPHVRGDLPLLVVEQPFGPLIDHGLQPAHGVDRVVDRGADEPLGGVPPQAELDALAVDQDQAAIGRQRAVRDDELQGDGLAAAGFPADEHVPLGEGDMDALAQFVGAQVHRLPDRQPAAGQHLRCHG